MLRAGCFLLAVLAFVAIQIQGELVRGRLKKAPTTDESGNSVTVKYCQYLNQNYTVGENWIYPNPICYNCTCSDPSGLFCIGIGRKAAEYVAPLGCQLSENTCDVVYVKTSDTTQLCVTEESGSSEST